MRPLRAALALLLASPTGCTFGLDWSRPAIVLDDAPAPEAPADADAPRAASLDAGSPGDAPAEAVAPHDAVASHDVVAAGSGAVDTGAVDTGPGAHGSCGGEGEPCCAYGHCNGNRVCVASDGDAACLACGGEGERCCAYGACHGERTCTLHAGDETPRCR
ncbi:MAG: hypothetical protein U0324_02635 [Polyangiales bacterium]